MRSAERTFKAPQMKRLGKMMEWFKTVEGISYDEILEVSDGETWYNKDGDEVVSFDDINSYENTTPKEPTKYGTIFVKNLASPYKWIVRVSKLDEVIFNLIWNKVKKCELSHLINAISNMLNNYNLNVLIKTMKLLSLLILKFKEDYTKYVLLLKKPLAKSMTTQKTAFMIRLSKVFFYLSKYWMKPDKYVQFLCGCIYIGKGITAWKVLVEILVAYIHNTQPEFENLRSSKSFVSCVEGISSKTPICFNHFTGIIMLELQEIY